MQEESIRDLKKQRKFHRNLRCIPFNNAIYKSLDKQIHIKQDTLYVTQAKAFESLIYKFFNKLNEFSKGITVMKVKEKNTNFFRKNQ